MDDFEPKNKTFYGAEQKEHDLYSGAGRKLGQKGGNTRKNVRFSRISEGTFGLFAQSPTIMGLKPPFC